MSKHILVLGDPIIDSYLHLEPSGIAQEAPIAKYKVLTPNFSNYLGGASNVASQIRTLLVNTDWTVREYPGGGVFGGKACMKVRGMCGNTEVFRYDNDHVTPEITQEDLDRLSVGADAIVVSDYEKGAIESHLNFPTDIPLFIDCKHPSKFPKENAIYFPNKKEYRASAGFTLRKCLVTYGSEGAALTDGFLIKSNIKSPLPTQKPTSVIGAGDVVVATYTVASLLGFSPIDCSRIAVSVASLAVTKPFTPNVTIEELDLFCESLNYNDAGHLLDKFVQKLWRDA